MKILLALLAALLAPAAFAQAPPTYGCDTPESKLLDFWLGDWELSYVEGGAPVRSRNRVSKILGGCVILEEFSGAPGTPLDGKSFSTYDRATRQWKQTWVDNTASYLDFTGSARDGSMFFAREAQGPGGKFLQRMVFRDIQPDRFKWLWQRSDDAGRTWSTQWDIDYRRVK